MVPVVPGKEARPMPSFDASSQGRGPSMASSARIHPTAIISPEADLADNVEVGAHAIIEGKVTVGPDCVIRHGAFLYGPLTMGQGNTVFSGAILGESPQHLKFKNEPTNLQIGDGNTFREFVTVHRGTTHTMKTVVGNNNYFMVNSHIGHDCVVGSHNIFANGALVAGHCIIADNVYLSGNCAIHQFVRVGRLALLSGCSATTKDIPPFVIQQGVDNVVGLNLIGMRRAGMKPEQINGMRQAFRLLFREGYSLSTASARIDKDLGHLDAVQELLTFLRQPGRGINPMRERRHHEEAA
jgi:UDP-N-acetylglucosamine acyltransferase